MRRPRALRWAAREAPALEILRETYRTWPAGTAALTAVVAVGMLLPALIAVASGTLAGAVHRAVGGELPPTVVRVVLLLGVVFLAQQWLPQLGLAMAEDLGRRLERATADRVVRALHRDDDLSRLEDRRAGELLATIRSGTSGSAARDAVVGLVNMSLARGGAAVCGLVLVTYRWWLGLLLVATYAYATVLISRGYQRALVSAEGAPARVRRAMYLKDLLSTAPAGKEVRVFGLQSWLLDGYRREWRTALADLHGERTDAGRTSLVSAALVLAVQLPTFVLLARDVGSGRLGVTGFTVYAVAAIGLLGMSTVTPDLMNIATGGTILTAVGRLEDLVPSPQVSPPSEVVHPPACPDVGPRASSRVGAVAPREGIVFDGVGFRYPGSSTWVLRNLDLSVPVGSSTALVGVNGAGKTTLVKLLCGLYTPTEGRILVDGVDLADLDRGTWQRRFAALFQDWVRWGLSVRENVLLGAPAVPADTVELDRIAAACGLDDIIDALPHGWSTVLSREFGGVDLSGGQWQRVGLARALWALRGGADALVLDEPTAALDVRGETELFDLMLDEIRGRTMVLVSHRFSTVRRADRIVVLESGRVVEQGDHDGLLDAGGRYAEMFTRQAIRFADGATT